MQIVLPGEIKNFVDREVASCRYEDAAQVVSAALKRMAEEKPMTVAQQDIDDILQYTLDEWGEDQIETYETVLYGAFRRLRNVPELGPLLQSGVREHTNHHHVILYRYDNGAATMSPPHDSPPNRAAPGLICYHACRMWPRGLGSQRGTTLS